MKIKTFITSSALVFAVWLGGTFVREVPMKQYPLLGTSGPLTTQEEAVPQTEDTIVELQKEGVSLEIASR